MTTPATLVIVDDNKHILTAAEMLLNAHFNKVIILASPHRLPSVLREAHPGVVLLDMNFSNGTNNGNEGLFWLKEIKRLSPETAVVLFTAYAEIDLAVRGIKEGAADFVVKPWDNDKLVEVLLHAAKPQKKKERTISSPPDDAGQMYWGNSQRMSELRLIAEKVATTDANILITGENGTGKEMLAKEIHRLSTRRKRTMVTVDMGTVTESLFESELFGHVKGAFTDAHADRQGKFEAAEGSTLFLDEIGNLPYHLQSKLLTVLQQRRVVRVGSNLPIPIDIRLITATNSRIKELVAKGEFREDLLYRLNTIHLEMPPLRERKADIVPLANRFIEHFSRRYGKSPALLAPAAKKRLTEHPWCGNIRELEHAIEKAVILCDGEEIGAQVFTLNQRDASPTEASTLEDMERKMIAQAIRAHRGNLTAVAVQLGITRQTLYNKMKKFEL